MSIQDHILRKDNPHNVTKEQVELGNILNYPTASVAEIEGLSANNRYIKGSDLDAVNNAFVKYMQDIGLANPDGSIKRSPTDTSGDVDFQIKPDGSVVLKGTHPTAATVDVVITQSGNKVFSENNIAVTANAWQAEVSSLVLDTSLPYNQATIYRDTSGKQISRSDQFGGEIPTIDNGKASLLINRKDNTGVVSGNTPGVDSVDVEVRENGDLVFSGSNIPVDKENGDFWSVKTGDVVLDPNANHEMGVVGKDGQGNPVGKHESSGSGTTTTAPGPVVDLEITEAGDATLEGYMPGADHAEVVIKQDGNVIFEDASVPVSSTDGHWSVDLSGTSFDPDKDHAVTAGGFDATGNKIIESGDTVVGNVPDGGDGGDDGGDGDTPPELGPNEGALVEYDEAQGVYYYDFRHFSNWEGVTIQWLDKGNLPAV